MPRVRIAACAAEKASRSSHPRRFIPLPAGYLLLRLATAARCARPGLISDPDLFGVEEDGFEPACALPAAFFCEGFGCEGFAFWGFTAFWLVLTGGCPGVRVFFRVFLPARA